MLLIFVCTKAAKYEQNVFCKLAYLLTYTLELLGAKLWLSGQVHIINFPLLCDQTNILSTILDSFYANLHFFKHVYYPTLEL